MSEEMPRPPDGATQNVPLANGSFVPEARHPAVCEIIRAYMRRDNGRAVEACVFAGSKQEARTSGRRPPPPGLRPGRAVG